MSIDVKGTAAEVIAQVNLCDDQALLEAAYRAEQDGKARSTVLAAIEGRLADLQDPEHGDFAAASQPDPAQDLLPPTVAQEPAPHPLADLEDDGSVSIFHRKFQVVAGTPSDPALYEDAVRTQALQAGHTPTGRLRLLMERPSSHRGYVVRIYGLPVQPRRPRPAPVGPIDR